MPDRSDLATGPGRHGPLAVARRLLLRIFGRLPRQARAWVARRASVAYYVGTLGFVVDEGRVLLVRPVYRSGWGAPGGLVRRGEEPADAIVRELEEELGMTVTLVGEPRIEIDPRLRGVTAWFRCAPEDVAASAEVAVRSPELDAVAWFPLSELPTDLHIESRRGLEALGLADH